MSCFSWPGSTVRSSSSQHEPQRVKRTVLSPSAALSERAIKSPGTSITRARVAQMSDLPSTNGPLCRAVVLVAEHLADDLERDPVHDRVAGDGVPQVVQADVGGSLTAAIRRDPLDANLHAALAGVLRRRRPLGVRPLQGPARRHQPADPGTAPRPGPRLRRRERGRCSRACARGSIAASRSAWPRRAEPAWKRYAPEEA